MATINLEEAQAHLPQIIDGLTPGEPLVIMKDGEPVATLTRPASKQWPCKAGSAKEIPHWMAPDFDAPLDTSGITPNERLAPGQPCRALVLLG